MTHLDVMKDREALENYFSLLKSKLVENDLMDKSSQIYNVDESGVPPAAICFNKERSKKVKKRSGAFCSETRHK